MQVRSLNLKVQYVAIIDRKTENFLKAWILFYFAN
jgi:hypothetical protein